MRVKEKLMPGGALVIGMHESLPPGTGGLTVWMGGPCVYQIKRCEDVLRLSEGRLRKCVNDHA